MDDLIGDFVSDVRSGFARVRAALVQLPLAPDDQGTLDALFRFVHTVNGNAGFLRLGRFCRLASAAEEMLEQLRDGRASTTPERAQLLVALIQRIGTLAEAMEAGRGVPADDEADMISRLGIKIKPQRAAALPEAQLRAAKGRSVRLSIDQFEQLARTIEGVAEAHSRLLGLVTLADDSPLTEAISDLSDRIAAMDGALSRSRLQPVERLYAALDRIVVQTAESLGKEAVLEVSGGQLMIDREVVDGLRDSVLHLVRNALDHGIEPGDIRRAANKQPKGSIRLAAVVNSGLFELTIADDGAGVRRDKVVTAAAARNIHLACDPRHLSDGQLASLIFAPGITTASEANSLSGRGVGLDVVNDAVTRLGGEVVLEDCPGQGVAITLKVPLRHAA